MELVSSSPGRRKEVKVNLEKIGYVWQMAKKKKELPFLCCGDQSQLERKQTQLIDLVFGSVWFSKQNQTNLSCNEFFITSFVFFFGFSLTNLTDYSDI